MSIPTITFLSDFGHEDWFVGVVHGVVGEVCPQVRIVDLTHQVAPGDVTRAAFILEAAAPDFPAGTIHLVVVDPGVGTERRALAVRAHGQLFVGPDNGVLDWALTDPAAEMRALSEPRYFRHPVSRTFHGRDVFGPVAAHLASGAAFESLGPVVADPMRLPRPEPEFMGSVLRGRVVFVDRFGNALTNLTGPTLERAFPGVAESALEVRIYSRRVPGITRSYGDAPIGTLIAILGSSGRLELAEVGGSASSRWGIGPGDQVEVIPAPAGR
ncbi:MAG: SAM-dependent chlorinase/fluorinase [Candidatus Eisenbacteria bacterium]